MSTNDTDYQTIAISSSNATLVAQNNPKRWAVGFIPSAGAGSSARVFPWSDNGGYGWPLVLTAGVAWFTLFEFGPLVTREWYVGGMAGFSVRVVEVSIG